MPRYVIHIGPHKTGSTYLQARFAGLQAQLAERAILHPPQWSEGNQVSHVALVRRLRQRDAGLAQELAALNASAHEVALISAEDLSDLKPEELAFLRQLIGEAPAEVVFYCRRWSELLLSGWQEMVKHGHIASFAELFSAAVMNPHASHVINFKIRLDRFAAAFGREANIGGYRLTGAIAMRGKNHSCVHGGFAEYQRGEPALRLETRRGATH